MEIKDSVKNMMKDVIEWRRYLHKHPETGFDLDNTVKFVCEKLDEMNIEYETDMGSRCSVIAYINRNKPGKCIAIRADMDALPIKEATDFDFKSENDNMHACGHDAHTAGLLCVCRLLKERENELNGRVKFIFQPAEEIGEGAKGIVEKGVIDDVDEIIGLHVGNIYPEGKKGNLIFTKGPMMACMDKFILRVKGQGAHGAYPHLSKDPIVTASHIIVGIQEILGREINPVEPAVVTIGSIKGGTAFNIIPEIVEIEGTVRAVNNDTRNYIKERVEQIASNIASAFRCETEYEFFYQPPPLINNEKVTTELMKLAEKLYPGNVEEMKSPVMGGEDFAWYLQKIPGAFFFVHNPLEIDGKVWAHHTPKFAIDEDYMDRGIVLMAEYAKEFLK
ncbi:MAG: M20 family metallopeptidase [Leptotrichiaceae bacterium]|nr:M20 family metallopeptidase [Leptotrichiaceae bacterium]